LGRRPAAAVLSVGATFVALLVGAGLQRNSGGAGLNTPERPSPSTWRRVMSVLDRKSTPASTANVLTYHNDVARTGQNLNEKILTDASVRSDQFGKIGFLETDGLVDAEPLYVSDIRIAGSSHNVVYVVTEHDSVYAFDADTLVQLWHVTVLGADEIPSDDRNCAQVSPEIGITSTPVISVNGDHGMLYLVAMSKDSYGNYYQRLHALDLSSGAEIPGGPTTIEATFPNLKGQTVFDPKQYKERASLLLFNDVVYTSWASHCDEGEYTGWIMGYSASTLKQTSVLNVTPNGNDGAIWMSGAGPAADPQGFIYIADANGTFDDQLTPSGFPIHGDFGNAFLKLTAGGGTLRVADYFNTHDTQIESGRDEDFGSGGALVLPDFKDGSGAIVQLAVAAGKDKRIYVVNRNSMGKFTHRRNRGIYQEIDSALAGQVFAMPAYFNNTLYFGAINDTLKAFSIVDAKLVPDPVSKTAAHFAYPGTTPSVSANGISNGIVWAIEARGSEAGVLHAYEAGNLAHEFYNSVQAGGRDAFADNKFVTPMIANGHVYVGTLTGVIVFGLFE